MTRILLLRHSQSEWNAVGRWQGQADPPLSEQGRRDAALAATRIGTVDAIVSSDQQRAAGTAAIIAEAIGVGPVLVEPRLRERSVGVWSGLTRAEIEEQWPGALEARRPPAGYEPDDAVAARATEALVELAELFGDQEVLVVSHGGVIHALEGDRVEADGRLTNLEGRWLEVDGERVQFGPRLSLLAVDEPTTVDEVAAVDEVV